MTKNLQMFTVTYLGPTNTLGSRVRIYDNRFEKSKTIPFNYSYSGIYDMAKEYLEEQGFKILYMAETPKGYALMSDTFKSI